MGFEAQSIAAILLKTETKGKLKLKNPLIVSHIVGSFLFASAIYWSRRHGVFYPQSRARFSAQGVANAAVKAASVVPAVAIAAPGAGKSEPPELTESKPSFGDKQKPLYHMPLKWRKVIGKPQVRCEARAMSM